MSRDRRKFTGAGVVAVALLLSACDGGPEQTSPSPAPSTGSALASPDALIAEHDGYVAKTDSCSSLDWTPLQVIGPFEADPGGYVDQDGLPVAYCSGGFPGEGDGAPLGTLRVTMVLQPNEGLARSCETGKPNQAEGDDPVWDFINGTVEAPADGFGAVIVDLRAGVLCVNVFMSLDPAQTSALGDPETELRTIALALAENARETSLPS